MPCSCLRRVVDTANGYMQGVNQASLFIIIVSTCINHNNNNYHCTWQALDARVANWSDTTSRNLSTVAVRCFTSASLFLTLNSKSSSCSLAVTSSRLGWSNETTVKNSATLPAITVVDLLAVPNICEVLRSHPSRRDKHKEIRDFKSSMQ